MRILRSSLVFLVSICSLAEMPGPRPGAEEVEPEGASRAEELDLLTGRNQHIHVSDSKKVLKACLAGATLSHAEVAELLKKSTGITLVQNPETVPKALMLYLIAYLDVLNYRFPKGTKLRMVEESPKLVEEKDGTLFFAKNSVDNLFTNKLAQRVQAMKSPEEVTLKFTNTLFEQLTSVIAKKDKKFVSEILKQQFNLVSFEKDTYVPALKPKVVEREGVNLSIPQVVEAQEFSAPESVAILKQLVDLPKHLTDRMHLKRILRASRGYKYDVVEREGERGKKIEIMTGAIYHPGTQTIWIFDEAFRKNRLSGKRTVTHEIGHAVFSSLEDKEVFVNIGWRRKRGTGVRFVNSTKNYEIKPEFSEGKIEFPTDYSRESYEEHFAEAFALFVNNPKKLKSIAPKIFEYMTEKVFSDSRYSSIANRKFNLQTDFQKEDTEAPSLKDFKGSLSEFIILKSEGVQDGNILLKCTVKNLYQTKDPLDKEEPVKRVKVTIRDSKLSSFQCSMNLKCVDPKKGQYESVEPIPVRELSKEGNLYVQSLTVFDKEKNSRTYFTTNKRKVSLKKIGTSPLSERPKVHPLESKLDQIQITKIPESKPEPAFKVMFPIPKPLDLESMELLWEGETANEDLRHKVMPSRIESSKDRKSMSFRVHFPSQMPHQTVTLKTINIRFKQTQQWNRKSYWIFLEEKYRHSIEVEPSATDDVVVKILVKDIKLKRRTGKDGREEVELTIPVEGMNEKDNNTNAFSFGIEMIKAADPKLDPKSLPYTSGHAGRATYDKMSNAFKYSFRLPPYRATYIITRISAAKYYPATRQLGSVTPFMYMKSDEVEIKETELERYFVISP